MLIWISTVSPSDSTMAFIGTPFINTFGSHPVGGVPEAIAVIVPGPTASIVLGPRYKQQPSVVISTTNGSHGQELELLEDSELLDDPVGIVPPFANVKPLAANVFRENEGIFDFLFFFLNLSPLKLYP